MFQNLKLLKFINYENNTQLSLKIDLFTLAFKSKYMHKLSNKETNKQTKNTLYSISYTKCNPQEHGMYIF